MSSGSSSDLEKEGVTPHAAITGATATAAAASNDSLDTNIVTWDGASDAQNPQNWSAGRKWAITLTLSAIGFMTITASTVVAPALGQMANELRMSSVETQMALSAYVLALAFGPLFISPLSEVYGRVKVIHAWNAWFLVWSLVGGFANGAGLLIAARFLAGLGGSLDYAIGISVLGDLWGPEQRGLSLGLYNFIPLLGTVVGPIIGGYLTQGLSWRWLFWVLSIAQAAVMLLSIFTLRETHHQTILARRAKNLRIATGNQRLHTVSEEKYVTTTTTTTTPDGATPPLPSLSRALRRSLSRPFRLLITHPAIQLVSLVYAFNFGILFFVISTFADLWTSQYGQSVATSGLHYIAWVLGELVGAGLAAPLLDRVWVVLKRRAAAAAAVAASAHDDNCHDNNSSSGGSTRAARNDNENENAVVPEYRVPLMLPGAVLVPAGLFAYGWTAQAHAFWLVPDVCAAVLGCGTMSATIAVHGYLIDAYPEHTASANAAASFLSSLFGFAFPLFAPRVYESLGYGWGNSLLGFVALVVGLVGPWILWTFGRELREKKKEGSY